MTRWLAVVAVCLLAAPAAQAGWRATHREALPEPDTPWDADPTVQWAAPNQASWDRIYFDAWAETFAYPNIPSPSGTGQLAPRSAATSFTALLGYWRDCNRDGFVGDALTGATHYPTDALAVVGPADDALCPRDSPYNDGVWVTELLPIGREANVREDDVLGLGSCAHGLVCVGGGPGHVRDDAAKVWQDWGSPEGRPQVAPLYPFAPGTLDDTNGHFAWVDGVVYGRLSGCTDGWVDGACGLWPAANPLVPNVANPVTATARDRWVGDEGSEGRPIVEPWDWGTASQPRCELRPSYDLDDVDANGGLYPTLDHVWRSAIWSLAYRQEPWLTDESPGRLHHACSRHPDNEPLGGWGYPEGRPDALPASRKDRVDTTFRYIGAAHWNPSETGVGPDVWACLPDDALSSGTPTRCSGAWYSTSQWLHPPGLSPLEPRPGQVAAATFYADVNFAARFGPEGYSVPEQLDDRARALPAGANDAHRYGASACMDGASASWACDVQAWIDAVWPDPAAIDEEDIHRLPKVLDPYDLRDVDCYDVSALTALAVYVADCGTGPHTL